MSVSVPGRTGSTVMGRKTTCNGCGYSQYTVTSYYLDRKQWQANHPAYHLSVLPLSGNVRELLKK